MDQTVPVTGNDLAVRDHLEPLDHLDRLSRRKMDIETLLCRLQYQKTRIYEMYSRLHDTIRVARGVEREILSINLGLHQAISELQKMLEDNTLGQDICVEDETLFNFLNEESQEWKMPVEFLLKARSTELSAVEEFQTENELYIRIKEIRDAFNQLLCQAIYHRDFKEYVERIVVVLKRIDHRYDELVEKAIRAKLRLNGAE